MFQSKVLFLCVLIIAMIEYGHAAFQCYKCNNCGTAWDPNRAVLALTEGGGNYCTKQMSGTTVTKDYSPKCPTGKGVYCCQGDLCNSSNSGYTTNFAMLILFSLIGFAIRLI